MLEQKIEKQLIFSQTISQQLNILQMNRIQLLLNLQSQAKNNPLINISFPKNNLADPSIIENSLAEEKKLIDHIKEELILDITENDEELLYLIIGSLDSRGFLGLSVKQLCHGTHYNPIRIEELRKKIMHSSYEGLAAIDYQEYMSFMVHKYFPEQIEEKIFQYMSKKKISTNNLAKQLNTTPEIIQEHIKNLKKIALSPLGQNSVLIIPDFIVEKNNDTLSIRPLSYNIPHITFNKLEENRYTKKELSEFQAEALFLKKALENREESLRNHAEALILSRSDFFLNTKEKSVQLKDISFLTGRHISTVSRALKGRTFLFNGQIYKFKELWNHKIGNTNSETIKHMIQELIAYEDSSHPLSDESIMRIFHKKGIFIARRTITKYRKILNIGTIHERKTLYK